MARDVWWWREELDRQANLAAEKEAARNAKAPVTAKLRGARKVAKSSRKQGKVTAAKYIVATEWEVSRTTVEQAVRDYGADAQEWVKKYCSGDDSDSMAVNIGYKASIYRNLAIERKRSE